MMGSTTTFLQVIQKNKEAVAKQTGVELSAVGATTGKGFTALQAGQIEIALSADTLENLVATAAKKGTVIAAADYEEVFLKDSYLVVIANKLNASPKLSEAQIRGILTGEIKSWSEVGGGEKPIAIFFEKEESANFSLIKNKLLKDGVLTKRLSSVDNVRLVASNVGEVESAFGISPEMYLNDQVKILSDYKIGQHLCLIIRKDASANVKQVAEAFKAVANK